MRPLNRSCSRYLEDPEFDIRLAALFALGERGDPAAIAPLEAMLNGTMTRRSSDDRGSSRAQTSERRDRGNRRSPARSGAQTSAQVTVGQAAPIRSAAACLRLTAVVERLDRLERTCGNERPPQEDRAGNARQGYAVWPSAIPRAECAGRADCCRWGRFRWRLRVAKEIVGVASGARIPRDRDSAPARARASRRRRRRLPRGSIRPCRRFPR